MSITPSELGFMLEEIIHTSAQLIPDISASRETDIRARFSDSSLNGVDHLITKGATHILIQDKWKESTSQPEVAQFITCAERIRSRLPPTDNVFLVWASKISPTSHAKKTLDEHGINQVICGVSIQALARCVILQICECFDVDPTDALKSIKSIARPTLMGGSRRELIVLAGYDEIPEGVRDKSEICAVITSIDTIITRITNAINTSMCSSSNDIRTLWEKSYPKTEVEWWNGSIQKIDFTAFLKSIKPLCCPTPKIRLQSYNLFLYVKLRKASMELAAYADTYETKRHHMLIKQSEVAKKLPSFKSTAEPIAEEEFKKLASYCNDYWINRKNHITGKIEQMPSIHIQTAFCTYQCIL